MLRSNVYSCCVNCTHVAPYGCQRDRFGIAEDSRCDSAIWSGNEAINEHGRTQRELLILSQASAWINSL